MAKADFALIGDSHAGAIGKAARAHGLAFSGGPLASGREFFSDFFEIADAGIVFNSSETEEMHQELCDLLNIENLSVVDVPVLSTVGSGFHVPATCALWSSFLKTPDSIDPGFAGSSLMKGSFERLLAPALGFHQHLINAGTTVQFVVPPQRVPDTSSRELMRLFQEYAIGEMTGIGCQIVDTRTLTCGEDGHQRPEYCQQNDPVHANTAFGTEVLKAAGYLR